MREPPLDRLPVPSFLIGGRRLDHADREQIHVYAATGRLTFRVPIAGVRDVDLAVAEAKAATRLWRRVSGRERSRVLHAVGEAIERHAEELALIQTVEMATPVRFSAAFPRAAADQFFYYAGWADKVSGQFIPGELGGGCYTSLEPYGVIAALTPWNASMVAAAQVLAPALAGGNTVVLKCSDLAPFTALRLAELALESGVPPGVVNVIVGGAEAGQCLVGHVGVSKVHFTGSPGTARSVLGQVARNVVPACLELGGKSPELVFADADLMAAAQVALSAMVGLSGQGCVLPQRILVQADVYDRFLSLLNGLVRRITVGDPLDPDTHMGPLVCDRACGQVLAAIDAMRWHGSGTLITGGTRMGGELSNGYFVAPTVFADVAEGDELAWQEVFGPVVSVLRFDHESDAVRMTNAPPYGLAAFVFTNDVRRAHRVSEALEVGTVWVNGMDSPEPVAPFGGCKLSGYGRLGGLDGLREFTRAKTIRIKADTTDGRQA
jgi:aldehyde dehydrogenase (NAD+)